MNRTERDEKAIALYAELQNYSEVARRLDVAPNTVRNIIKRAENNERNAEILQEYKEVKKNERLEILELVKSAKYSRIANDIVGLLDRESLRTELEKRGIRNLTALLGNSVDKIVKVHELEIHKKKLELQERKLALKEKELEARMERPELFDNVTIINDADKAAEYYEEQYKPTNSQHTN